MSNTETTTVAFTASSEATNRKCLQISRSYLRASVNNSFFIMLNDSELATLRNRFKRDAEFLMQTTSAEEDEKSKSYKCYGG